MDNTVIMRHRRTNGLTAGGMCMVNATKDLTESSNARGVRLPPVWAAMPASAALFHQTKIIRKTVSSTYRMMPGEHDPEHGEMRDAGGGVCGLGHRDFLFVGTDARMSNPCALTSARRQGYDASEKNPCHKLHPRLLPPRRGEASSWWMTPRQTSRSSSRMLGERGYRVGPCPRAALP